MNRYDILLKKTLPPPPKKTPPPKKAKKKRKIREQIREEIIAQSLSTFEGRARLATSLVDPIRRRLDHSSFARRIFRVDPLEAGALPIYDKVETETAYTIAEDGTNIFEINRHGRIITPLFETADLRQIPLSQLRHGNRLALIERAQQEAVNQIKETEDTLAFRLLDAATDSKKIEMQEISPNIISGVVTDLERNDLRIATIFMHPQVYIEFIRSFRDHIDAVTDRQSLEIGLMGALWGAQLFASNTVPNHNIYFVTEPQYVGVMPIRADLTILSADNPVAMSIGWSIFEQIGMACLNSRGLMRISLAHEEEIPAEESVQPIQAWDGTEWINFIIQQISG